MKPGFSLEQYMKEVAGKLRQHEAERIRGDLTLLEELENTTDLALLRKWGWISSIIGAGVAFIAMPFVIGLLQHFLPDWIGSLLWATTKVAMGLSLLMFGMSVYFTIGPNSEK